MAKWLGPGMLRMSGTGKKYAPGEDIDGDDLRKLDPKVRNKMVEKGQIDGNKVSDKTGGDK